MQWAEQQLDDRRERALFRRMTARSGIEHRWSVLAPPVLGGSLADPAGFYHGQQPGTAARMQVYAREAPKLALQAIAGLGPLPAVSHLIVASCTGFVAPGIDQIIAAELGLGGGVERTLVGFMGCYAAASAMRLAHHVVRSQPDAQVLVVAVELSTLHLQEESRIDRLLAMLQFGDGAAAALVSAAPQGLAITAPFAATLPDSHGLIRWDIGDQGFVMQLSGEVPGRIGEALQQAEVRRTILGVGDPGAYDSWAVHAGGRSILDAVEQGLGLPPEALAESRRVLADNGNVSSATLLFVLAAIMADSRRRRGVALAFGPGLAAEGFRFDRAP